MRRIIVLVLTCAVLVLGATLALAADAPTDPVEMKFPTDANKFAPIMFEHHAQHLALPGGCQDCHHKWDGSSAITGCRVDGCHTDIENKKQPTSYDSAFHARKAPNSCVGCHSAMSKENADFKGPTKCNACHTKP